MFDMGQRSGLSAHKLWCCNFVWVPYQTFTWTVPLHILTITVRWSLGSVRTTQREFGKSKYSKCTSYLFNLFTIAWNGKWYDVVIFTLCCLYRCSRTILGLIFQIWHFVLRLPSWHEHQLACFHFGTCCRTAQRWLSELFVLHSPP